MSNGLAIFTGGNGLEERHENDYYPTPTASTIALLDYIKENNLYNFDGCSVAEPAAGGGHITNVLKSLDNVNILSSDLYDYGNPEIVSGIDFIDTNFYDDKDVDWIITNPPYDSKLLMPFIHKALRVSNKGVMMFLKLTFLESTSRMEFFKTNKMLKHVLVFSNRQPMYKNGEVKYKSSAIAYAWYIWDKDYVGQPQIDWIDNSELCKAHKKEGLY